jgi:hypothetical protein
MKWIILLLVFSLLVLFSSCCGLKKIKTTTVTETIYQVDTVIKVVRDTVTKVVYGDTVDTLYIENEVASARTYYNVQKQKVVLELKGKVFDVPVTMNKVVRENKKTVDIKRNVSTITYVIGCTIFLFILFIVAKILDYLK